MKSMTGFGSGTATKDGITCTVEIKSVNARFLDLFIRSPKQINPFESIIRGLVQDRITRGKVEVSVSIQDAGERPKTFTINSVLRKQIQELLVQEEFYDDPKKVPLQAVNSISNEWIQQQDTPIAEDVLSEIVQESTNQALDALITMRTVEGKHIEQDLLSRITTLENIIKIIDENKAGAVDAYREHIKGKIQEYLVSLEASISEDRFLQEIALLADKTDITEEIVRFTSHVVQLKNTLVDENSIGRKVDFILQEMNREVNTIGSKAMDSSITEFVVQLKCELEKIREQVQNVE
ncbi:MAG: YicC/YloC family endoribonuclease [Veillonella sp.]|jgi:TIGR00255 family protein|uniref:YicC/YloC family endoribonuclease n=1 Tax=Veillonella sp. TaxID=1926307 RepID=UPI00101F2DBD|nr:YicC/YloC family endoribonuclease [Veillonella sp.]MTG94924.1 YicC family protein [Veillonella dispar]MBS5765577.1 YicC family protein [Veillonella sp.]MBS7142084.1 YicC family protein [Veillonella sp.]MDU2300617.1 YicC/YloC family endoribonuclease [Veillonella sp.]MDU2387463.1 YicC/YloC family endoribonuclease [Veillonella sp.]